MHIDPIVRLTSISEIWTLVDPQTRRLRYADVRDSMPVSRLQAVSQSNCKVILTDVPSYCSDGHTGFFKGMQEFDNGWSGVDMDGWPEQMGCSMNREEFVIGHKRGHVQR